MMRAMSFATLGFSAINAIIILYFLRWVLHFHSSGLLGLVRFQAFVLLLFLLGGGLVLTLFQRFFAPLGGFVGLALRIDRYLCAVLAGGGNFFHGGTVKAGIVTIKA